MSIRSLWLFFEAHRMSPLSVNACRATAQQSFFLPFHRNLSSASLHLRFPHFHQPCWLLASSHVTQLSRFHTCETSRGTAPVSGCLACVAWRDAVRVYRCSCGEQDCFHFMCGKGPIMCMYTFSTPSSPDGRWGCFYFSVIASLKHGSAAISLPHWVNFLWIYTQSWDSWLTRCLYVWGTSTPSPVVALLIYVLSRDAQGFLSSACSSALAIFVFKFLLRWSNAEWQFGWTFSDD